LSVFRSGPAICCGELYETILSPRSRPPVGHGAGALSGERGFAPSKESGLTQKREHHSGPGDLGSPIRNLSENGLLGQIRSRIGVRDDLLTRICVSPENAFSGGFGPGPSMPLGPLVVSQAEGVGCRIGNADLKNASSGSNVLHHLFIDSYCLSLIGDLLFLGLPGSGAEPHFRGNPGLGQIFPNAPMDIKQVRCTGFFVPRA